ncbi:Uncharacterized protein QTN25_001085 [Entamoeba marina]
MSDNTSQEISWDDVCMDWNQNTNPLSFDHYKCFDHFNLFLKYATTSPHHRYTLFQIFDSLKYICKSPKEYELLFWKYLQTTKSIQSREVVPMTLPLPESEQSSFNLELKFQQDKIVVEFHSELALYKDRDIPCNTINRHNAIQSLFNDKISALILPLSRYENNTLQQQIQSISQYDMLFGGYEEQISTLQQNNNNIMNVGDFYVTLHSTLLYHMIIHCKFDSPFQLNSKDDHYRFYSNLIFYLHRCKTSELYFCMHELETTELPQRITSVFSAVRQAILNDGDTSLQRIVFICPDTDLNLQQLKQSFDKTFVH